MKLRFGVFELDEEAGELRRAGRAVPIQPKPFDLLRLLVREQGRLVSSEELMEALWPDTVVTPGSLTRAVSYARRAIGDTGRGELLKSVARRGYRFAGDVDVVGEAAEAPRPTPLPDGSSPAPRVPDFVGRQAFLAHLEAARDKIAEGRGAVVFVTGPAGIGKTKLTEVFAADLERQGLLVVWGRCRDRDGAPPLWLWAQILQALARDEDLRQVIAAAAAGGDIAALLPALDEYAPALAPKRRSRAQDTSSLPGDRQRFALFEAAGRLLRVCAEHRPLALMLEDLQWAGSGSLHLFDHFAAELPDVPLLMVATVRDASRERGHPIDRTLAASRQLQHCRNLTLAGLSRGEVGQLLSQAMGQPAPVDLTSELFARTEGIPFFVGEAIRLLAERGDLDHPERIPRHGVALPTRAVDFIQRTLDGVSSACMQLLGASSVLGREFTLTSVASVADVPREDALEGLDDGVRSGVIQEMEDGVAQYRFRHALFQEALYEALPASARARLHRRAAARLERQHAKALDPVLAELAHHHHRSIAVGDPERAFEIAIRAGRRAEQISAFEQAAAHYEQGLDALEHCEELDAEARLETLLSLGEAHRLSGDRVRRSEVFIEAMELARLLERARAFTRAAIGFCDLTEWSATNERARACVEDAVDALESDDAVGKARLTTRLAYLSIRDRSVAEPLALEAVRLSRECGDVQALLEALHVLHYALAGPDDLQERARLLDEIRATMRSVEKPDAGATAMIGNACDRLIECDIEAAKQLRDECLEVVTTHAAPTGRWQVQIWDTGLALLEGRFADALQGAHDAHLLGRRIGHPFAPICFRVHMAMLDRERGEEAAVAGWIGRGLDDDRLGDTHWTRAAVARAELASGNEDHARALFERLAAPGFDSLARFIRWHSTVVEIALLCAELGAQDHAKPLIELLASAPGQHALLPGPVVYGGPLAWGQAALFAAQGVADDALALFDEALESSERLGARPTHARISLDAAPLVARCGDTRRARSLLEGSVAIAEELEMAKVANAARKRLARY